MVVVLLAVAVVPVGCFLARHIQFYLAQLTKLQSAAVALLAALQLTHSLLQVAVIHRLIRTLLAAARQLQALAVAMAANMPHHHLVEQGQMAAVVVEAQLLSQLLPLLARELVYLVQLDRAMMEVLELGLHRVVLCKQAAAAVRVRQEMQPLIQAPAVMAAQQLHRP